MDVDIAVIGHAFKFWEARKSSIDFPLYSRDDQEWFTTEFRVWQDMRDPVFVLDLSLSSRLICHEIRVERALADLRECLREAIKDRDCCRDLADTFIKDIEEMSSA